MFTMCEATGATFVELHLAPSLYRHKINISTLWVDRVFAPWFLGQRTLIFGTMFWRPGWDSHKALPGSSCCWRGKAKGQALEGRWAALLVQGAVGQRPLCILYLLAQLLPGWDLGLFSKRPELEVFCSLQGVNHNHFQQMLIGILCYCASL